MRSIKKRACEPAVQGLSKILFSVLKKYPQDTVFLAAVSGGADSMAMLSALYELQQKALIPQENVFCLHVEHGLRPPRESKGDAEYVRAFCTQHGINFRIVSIPSGKIKSFSKKKGVGIEAAARYFRHSAFMRYALKIEHTKNYVGKVRILTAHTKDDVLELALMRILRGSGPAGLAGMPESRGRYLRPLLAVSRKEIIQYLKEKNILWREDSTNTDEKFLRNRVRHRLVPLLDAFFPSWKKGITGMAETQGLVSDFIKTMTANCACKKEGQRSEQDSIVFDKKTFFSQPQIIREELIFYSINKFLDNATKFPAHAPRERAKPVNTKSIKRAVVRKFCEGSMNAADLGNWQIKCKEANVEISLKQKEIFERGISFPLDSHKDTKVTKDTKKKEDK